MGKIYDKTSCLSKSVLNIIHICSVYVANKSVALQNENRPTKKSTHIHIGQAMNWIFLDWITANSKQMYSIT